MQISLEQSKYLEKGTLFASRQPPVREQNNPQSDERSENFARISSRPKHQGRPRGFNRARRQPPWLQGSPQPDRRDRRCRRGGLCIREGASSPKRAASTCCRAKAGMFRSGGESLPRCHQSHRSSSTCSADADITLYPQRSAQYLSFPKASTVRPSAGMMYPEPLAYGTK